MAYGEEALADDEKVAMEILGREFDWYIDLGETMDKSFDWSNLGDDDSRLFLEALTSLCKPRRILCDLMYSIEIHHKDLSNHKSLINDLRTKLYDYLFGISHKFSDPALKEYFASFQPFSTKYSLPFPDSDSKEGKDGETSSLSENSSISSNTESEMFAKIRKSSEKDEVEGESDGSSDTYYPKPPSVLEFMHHFSRDYDMYHDHDHCDLNYRFNDDDDDHYFD